MPVARWGYSKWLGRTVPVEAALVETPIIDGAPALILANNEPGPHPLVIFMHGHGGSANTLQLPRVHDFSQTLVDMGVIVAASDASGDAWGSPDAVADYLALHDYISDRWEISHTVLVGESMGAIPAVNIAADQAIPGVTGAVLVSPVVNLGAAAAQGPLVEAIEKDRANVDAVDPMGRENVPVPVTIHAGPDDSVVRYDDVKAWAAGRPNVRLAECEGNHVDRSCYDPESVLQMVR